MAPEHGVGALTPGRPDGDRLAYTAEADPPRFLIPETRPAGQPERTADRPPLGRRIRRADWRWDEDGHLDRWEHLFVDPGRPGARPRRLTRGDWGVQQPSWDPSGRSLVFAADRRPTADL